MGNSDQSIGTDHLCIPCDVDTMARRANLTPRRVQQLAKEGVFLKNEQGEYLCPHNLMARIRDLDRPKRRGVSGLVKKQEESLDIRNTRERMEALAQWETMVLQKAIIQELATIAVALKNGIRELPSALAEQVVLFAKDYADKAKSGIDVPVYELMTKAQKLLAVPLDEKLDIFAKDIQGWIEKQESDEKRREPTDPDEEATETR